MNRRPIRAQFSAKCGEAHGDRLAAEPSVRAQDAAWKVLEVAWAEQLFLHQDDLAERTPHLHPTSNAMSGFSDQMLIRFSDSAFVRNFLENRVGLGPILSASYELDEFELQTLTLKDVLTTELSSPTLQTVRMKGTEEQVTPNSVRSQITRSFHSFGRLIWVDVLLDVLLGTTLQDNRMPIESVATQQLLQLIGGAVTLNELRAKLEARYSPDIVDSMFKHFRITSIDEFRERLNYVATFLFMAPQVFNPNDSTNSHFLKTTVCVNFQPDLDIIGALQNAKLSRAILDDEREATPLPRGIVQNQKHVFVAVFPDSAVDDNTIPGMTAIAVKNTIANIFAAEGMIGHFFP